MDRIITKTPGEVDVYQGYVEQMISGQVPYHDYWFEYPPGILPIALIPRLMTSDPTMYFFAWQILIVVVILLCWMAIKDIYSRSITLMGSSMFALFFALITSAGIFLFYRYDFLVAAIVLFSMFTYSRGKFSLSAALMTFAVFTKLYPIILCLSYSLIVQSGSGPR